MNGLTLSGHTTLLSSESSNHIRCHFLTVSHSFLGSNESPSSPSMYHFNAGFTTHPSQIPFLSEL